MLSSVLGRIMEADEEKKVEKKREFTVLGDFSMR